jgi:V8-like Glu-specific endopeptidase
MAKKILKLAVFIIVLAMILSFTGMLSAQPTTYELTAQDKVILTQPAVCFVTTYFWGYVLDPWDNVWSDAYYWAFVGTGFSVNPDSGHIVTAGHMVEISAADFKYDLIYVYLTDTYGSTLDSWNDDDWNWAYENTKVEGYDGGDYDMEAYVQFNTANGGIPDDPSSNETFIRAELIDFSGWEQRDIAILRIQPQTGRALSSVLVGDSSLVEIQDSLTIIGYPWTSDIGQQNVLNPTITNGSLSGKIMLAGTEVMQIQGSAREGNSGGPVLNQNGEVIGILTMGTDYSNNYLRPSNDVKEMLSKNGVTNTLGMVDEEFKQGLVNYRLKHYTKAIEHFNAVLNLNQRHLQAQEYRSKSQEAINRGDEVPIEGEETITIVEPEEVTTDGATAGETISGSTSGAEDSGGLSTLVKIIIGVCGGFLFIAIIALIIILVVRKKRATAAPAATPAAEPQKTEVKEKKAKNGDKFCPNCGSLVKEGEKFCSDCGNKVE